MIDDARILWRGLELTRLDRGLTDARSWCVERPGIRVTVIRKAHSSHAKPYRALMLLSASNGAHVKRDGFGETPADALEAAYFKIRWHISTLVGLLGAFDSTNDTEFRTRQKAEREGGEGNG